MNGWVLRARISANAIDRDGFHAGDLKDGQAAMSVLFTAPQFYQEIRLWQR